MKKITIAIFLAAGLIAMAGITYAADDEDEIVKRHSEWMKKVMVGLNTYPSGVKAETEKIGLAEKINIRTPITLTMVEIFDADGRIIEIFTYDNPLDTNIFDYVQGLRVTSGTVKLYDSNGLKSEVTVQGGRQVTETVYNDPQDGLARTTFTTYDGPSEREPLNMGAVPISSVPAPAEHTPRTEIKDDGVYSGDVGTIGAGNIVYGGKADISIPGDVATQPTSQEQSGKRLTVAEEMTAMEDRLATDRQTTTTLVNGKIVESVEQPADLLPINPPSKSPGADRVKNSEGAAAYVFTSEMRVNNEIEEVKP